MKTKSFLFVSLFIFIFASTTSFAAEPVSWPWYQGIINKISTDDNEDVNISIKQEDGQYVNVIMDNTMNIAAYNRFLSIALTAFSKGATVNLKLIMNSKNTLAWGSIQLLAD